MSLESMSRVAFRNNKVYFKNFKKSFEKKMGDEPRLVKMAKDDLSLIIQAENLNFVWVAAWFGITIWILTTALSPVYSVLAFLLILRVASSNKSYGNGFWYQLLGMAPSVLVGISLTVYSWNLLNGAAAGTAYTVAQCLTGLALSGAILSGLIPVFNLIVNGLPSGLSDGLDLLRKAEKIMTKKEYQGSMAFAWINSIWATVLFALSIWVFTTWPTYSVSILLLAMRLALTHNSWMKLWETALYSGAFVGYVTLVENSTNSAPWIAILTMACIAVAVDAAALLTKAGVDGWFQRFTTKVSQGRVVQAFEEGVELLTGDKRKTYDSNQYGSLDLEGSKMPMQVPRSGLRKK
jgi:hypothetical protein